MGEVSKLEGDAGSYLEQITRYCIYVYCMVTGIKFDKHFLIFIGIVKKIVSICMMEIISETIAKVSIGILYHTLMLRTYTIFPFVISSLAEINSNSLIGYTDILKNLVFESLYYNIFC